MNENLENKISVIFSEKIEKERACNVKLFANKLTQTIVFTGVGLVLTGLVTAFVRFILLTLSQGK